MADLIAIGYPDETTALAAMDEVGRLERDLVICSSPARRRCSWCEKVTPDKAVEGLRQYGGTVLKSSLSKDAEAQLQDALHGQGTTA
jgi:uncharacterized membrane protein